MNRKSVKYAVQLTDRMWPVRICIGSKVGNSNECTVAPEAQDCIAEFKSEICLVSIFLVKVYVCNLGEQVKGLYFESAH